MSCTKHIIFVAIAFTLTACQNVQTQFSLEETILPVNLDHRLNDRTSAKYSKNGLPPISIYTNRQARVAADLNGDGYVDWFYATDSGSSDRGGRFVIYYGSESGRFEDRLLTGSKGCIYPSKPVVNDFNGDDKPDIFVSCSGWDQEPFPGEPSKVVLSGPENTYSVETAIASNDYRHGATSADFDGDGYADVLVTEGAYNRGKKSLRLQVYFGNGRGEFPRNETLELPQTPKFGYMYASVEAVDANRDGHFDLAIGGNEWSGEGHFTGTKTKLFFNKAINGFKPSNPLLIPPVKHHGMVLDFDTGLEGGDPAIFILRTGDGSADSSFYKGFYIQSVNLKTKKSKALAQNPRMTFIYWLKAWTVDGVQYVGSDDRFDPRLDPIVVK